MRPVPSAPLLAISCLLSLTSPAMAQYDRPQNEGGLVKSLGQPRRAEWFWGVSAGAYLREDERSMTGQLRFGWYDDITNPVTGLFGVIIDGYFGNRYLHNDGGVRARLASRFIGIAGGVDVDIFDAHADGVYSYALPIERGGLFRTGGNFWIEWLPTRGQSFNLVATFPVGQPNLGKTRPETAKVELKRTETETIPYAVSEPTLDKALRDMRYRMLWINQMTTPFFDQTGNDPAKSMASTVQAIKGRLAATSARDPAGGTSEGEVRAYHAELLRAFSIAASDTSLPFGASTPEGQRVADAAREILLEQVLFPYNRLLGQIKDKDTTAPFASLACGAFARWLISDSNLPPERFDALQFVFQSLVDFVEEARAFSHRAWGGDSQFVWLPLQFALLPEQHDSQEEIDRLVERATGTRFTDGNRLWYVLNEQFQIQLSHSIREANEYHVLWTHDFRGLNDHGEPDSVAYVQLLNSYLGALIDRVKRYDETGSMPVYMIFLDQLYYTDNRSRFWMKLLEDPLSRGSNLPGKHLDMEKSIDTALDELRAAVQSSYLLQAETRQYGERWLHNLIKVHVSITNPADFSFRGKHMWAPLGIPDASMRDHRKLVLYDVTEEDPYRGMAMYTGAGVGEHYVGSSWEDRTVMVQGPAALSLKNDARGLLLAQGLRPDEIPFPLRPRPMAADYDSLVAAETMNNELAGRALEVHNETGYYPKPLSVLLTTLYSLMPKRSVLIIPDSLWNSFFFGSVLVGEALRGGRVFIICPSIHCAPSAGAAQMSRAHELISKLIVIQHELGPEIAASGGMLKTGLYDPDVGVGDLRGRVRMVTKTVREHAFLRELFPADGGSFAVGDSMDAALARAGFKVKYMMPTLPKAKPKLHLKVRFLATPEAWDKLTMRPEWDQFLTLYITNRASQISHTHQFPDVREMPHELDAAACDLVHAYLRDLTPDEAAHAAYYLMAGSTNMDPRSLMMNGEDMLVTTGWQSLMGMVDFATLMGLSVWVDELGQLDTLLPRQGRMQRNVARLVKNGL